MPDSIKRTQARGSKPCEGNCGRRVSANKKRCISCLAAAAKWALERKGLEVEEDDLRRMIRMEAGA